MTNEPPPATPAGWYPEGANGLRYWDGSAWTDHRAPAGDSNATTRAPWSRNYLGDIGLALALLELVITVTIPAAAGLAIIVLGVAVLVLSLIGFTRARRSKITAIVALILAAVPWILFLTQSSLLVR